MNLSIPFENVHTGVHTDKITKSIVNIGLSILTTLTTPTKLLVENNKSFNRNLPGGFNDVNFILPISNSKVSMDSMTKVVMAGVSAVHTEINQWGQWGQIQFNNISFFKHMSNRRLENGKRISKRSL